MVDKHEEFWLDTGDMILLVDGIYFKIHSVVLAESCGLIKDMLTLPSVGAASQADGRSVEHPVPIHDVAFHDFEVILRDAYGRQPLLNFTPDAENMVRLAHAAHRLQSWTVLIAAATEAMKVIPATEQLVLHHKLDLEFFQAQQIEDAKHRHEKSNARAVARGLPERRFIQPTHPDRAWYFENVFCDVAISTSFKLPVAGLDDRLNLQLALARAALLEKRNMRLEGALKGDPFAVLVARALESTNSHILQAEERELVRRFCVHTKLQ